MLRASSAGCRKEAQGRLLGAMQSSSGYRLDARGAISEGCTVACGCLRPQNVGELVDNVGALSRPEDQVLLLRVPRSIGRNIYIYYTWK